MQSVDVTDDRLTVSWRHHLYVLCELYWLAGVMYVAGGVPTLVEFVCYSRETDQSEVVHLAETAGRLLLRSLMYCLYTV